MNKLQEKNVTVLWRPLHEAAGGWFWWGAAGPDAYKWLWELMYERQTYYHGLNNLIWLWNGQDADWYVGDELCDIVGMDIYADKHDYGSSGAKMEETIAYSNGYKLTTFRESVVLPAAGLLNRYNGTWLFCNL